MPISVSHLPSAGAYGRPIAQAAAYEQYANLMLPFAQQYIGQSYEASEAAKSRRFESSEAEKLRQWQAEQAELAMTYDWKKFYEQLPTQYRTVISGPGGSGGGRTIKSLAYKTSDELANLLGGSYRSGATLRL